MSEVRLAAQQRTEFGKGAARRIRRDHHVPAVMYGHGEQPAHLTLPGHETMLALKTPNVLLSIEMGKKKQLAIPKEVQRHPLKGIVEHVDLLMVRRGEKVAVEVPLEVLGEAESGSVLTHELVELEVMTEATNIPEKIIIDVTDKPIGSHISAGEVVLPAGVELMTDPEALVILVAAQQSAAAMEAELEEAESALGVVREEKENETAEAS